MEKTTIGFYLFTILCAMQQHRLKKLTLRTIGCRLNQYETEKMAADLYQLGFRRAREGETADLFIINTCTVTHRADSSSRNIISRAIKENPNARIVVAGCYVDREPERIAGIEGVDALVPNAEKLRIREILSKRFPDLFATEAAVHDSRTIADFVDYNRAWLKISDGCNQRCAFCVLPSVRGTLGNRPAAEIIEEINGLIDRGFNEVVLTGLNIGYYRDCETRPQVESLAHLCRMILRKTNLKRLRISSIEPQTLRDELVGLYSESTDRICRHFHTALQSGSSRILRLMRRPYNRDDYIRFITAIKKAVPETVIGADVIVGFPGETEQDFQETQQVAKSGLIDYLHVFSYSNRPGTPACELPDRIGPDVIKERNAVLSRISNELRSESHRRQVGRTLGVIAERKQKGKGFFWGISDNYVRVKLPSHYPGGRQIVKVRISSACDEYVEGDIVD